MISVQNDRLELYILEVMITGDASQRKQVRLLSSQQKCQSAENSGLTFFETNYIIMDKDKYQTIYVGDKLVTIEKSQEKKRETNCPNYL